MQKLSNYYSHTKRVMTNILRSTLIVNNLTQIFNTNLLRILTTNFLN